MASQEPDVREDLTTDYDEEVTEPPLFKVLLHNDDFTTKEFVVTVLVSIFNKSLDEATQLMWSVHRHGVGVAGVYPFEVAETKIGIVKATAKESGFPLQMTMEPE